jgi:hypothetical protein
MYSHNKPQMLGHISFSKTLAKFQYIAWLHFKNQSFTIMFLVNRHLVSIRYANAATTVNRIKSSVLPEKIIAL